MIDIKGINKAELLAALFNESKQQGMGLYDRRGAKPMTVEDAQSVIDDRLRYWTEKGISAEAVMSEQGLRFDYLRGRVMKVDIGGDELDPRLYDRDNGFGAADDAVMPLLVRAGK